MPRGQGTGPPPRSEGSGQGILERPPCRKLQGRNDSLSLHQVVIGKRVIGFSLERGGTCPRSVFRANSMGHSSTPPPSSGRELGAGRKRFDPQCTGRAQEMCFTQRHGGTTQIKGWPGANWRKGPPHTWAWELLCNSPASSIRHFPVLF